VGSRYAREDKKTGIFGYKRFRVPVNKASLFKFHDVECSTRDCGAQRGCSGSVSSQVVTRVNGWGNGLWNWINLSGVERASSSTNATSTQRLVRPGLQHGWGDRCDYVRHTTGPLALVHCTGAHAGDGRDDVKSEQDVWGGGTDD
jgi:hypothetical protein